MVEHEDDPTPREFLEQKIDHERELREVTQKGQDRRLDTVEREADKQEGRLGKIEGFLENLTGRMIGLGIIGAIFVAIASAVATRAIFGG